MENNSVYFSKEEIEQGLLNDLLAVLMKKSYAGNINSSCSTRYDILIEPADCEAFTVSWVERPWDNSWGDRYEKLTEDEEVFTRVELPDYSWEYVPRGEEDDCLKSWREEHPTFEQDREASEEALRKELGL